VTGPSERAERDPRVDPQRGDIVQIKNSEWIREVVEVSDATVHYMATRGYGDDVFAVTCSRGEWNDSNRGATVIQRGDA